MMGRARLMQKLCDLLLGVAHARTSLSIEDARRIFGGNAG
jgi:hypothetical protein